MRSGGGQDGSVLSWEHRIDFLSSKYSRISSILRNDTILQEVDAIFFSVISIQSHGLS